MEAREEDEPVCEDSNICDLQAAEFERKVESETQRLERREKKQYLMMKATEKTEPKKRDEGFHGCGEYLKLLRSRRSWDRWE